MLNMPEGSLLPLPLVHQSPPAAGLALLPPLRPTSPSQMHSPPCPITSPSSADLPRMDRWLKRAPGRAAGPSVDALPDELLLSVIQLVPEVTHQLLGSAVELESRCVPSEVTAAASPPPPPLLPPYGHSSLPVPLQWAGGARVPPLAPACAAADVQPGGTAVRAARP